MGLRRVYMALVCVGLTLLIVLTVLLAVFLTRDTQEKVIDSHIHFLDEDKFDYPWKTGFLDMKGYFMPSDFLEASQSVPVTGAVWIQATGLPEETDWAMELAKSNPWILGLVAGYDMKEPSEQFRAQLDHYKENPKLVGVRNEFDLTANDPREQQFLKHPNVRQNLQVLSDRGLAADLLVRPNHLEDVLTAVQDFPRLTFVINHLGSPTWNGSSVEYWMGNMRKIAHHQNVYCKISSVSSFEGLLNVPDSQMREIISFLLNAFGADHLMFGSDWPVSALSAPYTEEYKGTLELLGGLSASSKQKIFSENAIRAYKLVM